jgi:hypothetical protein
MEGTMNANTKTIDRIKSLRREAEAIGGFHALYAEKYAPDRNCDKKGYGFSKDDRFAAFTVNTKFESHKGYFGDSSCYTILSVYDREVVERAFVEALNIHQKELFATAARLMREEAAKLTEQAEKEIEALKSMLESARADLASPAPQAA